MYPKNLTNRTSVKITATTMFDDERPTRHNEEIKVHCSTACGLQYLVGRTFESERRREDVHVGTIGASTIGSSHDKEYIARMIKIRTYYEAKIKEELAKVRHTYSVKYQEFINEIQRHADEIM